jgi:hypothetical protein
VPRIRHINPELPQEFDDLIAGLMSREPADRPARANDVRVALSGLRFEPVPSAAEDHTMVVGDPVYIPPTMEDEEDESNIDMDDFIRSERSWMLPALALVLVATALIVAGALFADNGLADSVLDRNDDATAGQTTSPDQNAGTTTLTPVNVIVDPTLAGAIAIDPEGDGEERNDTAAFAIDGDDDTYWRSERYRSPDFGNLKSGVGLVIDLGGSARVNEVTLDTESEDWSVEIYIGDDFSGAPGTWGQPAAAGRDLRNRATFDIDALVGTQMLIWVTDPGTSDDADDNGEPDNRFELTEVEVS